MTGPITSLKILTFILSEVPVGAVRGSLGI